MRDNWNKLYKIKLGELLIIDNNTIIRRIPGGWIYSDMQGCCFIPFDNEFQEKEN